MEIEKINTVYQSYVDLSDEYDTRELCICRDLKTAEKEKLRKQEEIKSLKELYKTKYNSDYDLDLELIVGNDLITVDEDKYDQLTDSIYTFQSEYPSVKIININIYERPLI